MILLHLKRRYKIRAQGYSGRQVTLPPEVRFKKGECVTLLHDGFVVIVPAGTPVDEELLKQSIKLRNQRL